MRILIALLIICTILPTQITAQEFYADIVVSVAPDGIAQITGTTNHPNLAPTQTNSYTHKKGNYWLFNLTLPKKDKFVDYTYEIVIPKDMQINYVKTSGQFLIGTQEEKVVVSGFGKENLKILIQYKKPTIQQTPSPDEKSIYIIIPILTILLIFIIIKIKSKKERVNEFSPGLSVRQKQIIQELEKSDKPLNQKELCERLNLPKASVSRNVDTLEKHGLVLKTRDGMSTYLSLKKE